MSHSLPLDDQSNDLGKFLEIFFNEVDEHLVAMESTLLALDVARPDDEHLDAVFRAAHSIKGASAIFGFDEMSALTHEMETVFDHVRRGGLAVSGPLLNLFLEAGDLLGRMLAVRRRGTAAESHDEAMALGDRLRKVSGDADPRPPAGTPADDGGAVPPPGVGAGRDGATRAVRDIEIRFDAVLGHDVFAQLCDDFAAYGRVVSHAEGSSSAGDVAAASVRLRTAASAESILDALAFVVEPSSVRIVECGRQDVGSASTIDAPSGPAESPPYVVVGRTGGEAAPMRAARSTPVPDDTASIRVEVDKVDHLINIVGELVVTQAMLVQASRDATGPLHEALLNGIAQLQRNARDLQEVAMSIRMMPMSFAFSRIPRMVRDVAARLGKEVELHLSGEDTELDKGLIERIVDPLIHLVRNSLDHGVEPPEERLAAGKPRCGTIGLRAEHRGGAIVIEVTDDGRGLSRDRILAKARERGIVVADAPSDHEVWQLIFQAGFTTAEQVTDVSGRGVGMDVVRRNIQALGGHLEIHSVAGSGLRISLRLPLTLAVVDGLSIRLGTELFIVPLNYITESLKPAAGSVRTLGGSYEVIRVRGEYIPLLRLADIFAVPDCSRHSHEGIVVVLESDARRTALLVDGLVDQQQVVVKSLESNYRKVAGISGATVMGDGRVAMILDVPHMVSLSHDRLELAA